MRVVFFIGVIAAWLAAPPAATAEDVFDRLQVEPVTMLDFGIKRLRSMAQLSTRRVTLPAEPTAQVNVDFDPKKREIRIIYLIRTKAEGVTEASCRERRLFAIRDIFVIGATNYAVPMSEEQRIVMRLGRMFTREPADQRNAVQAMGERLSQSIIFQVNLYDLQGNKPITCGGPIKDLKGG